MNSNTRTNKIQDNLMNKIKLASIECIQSLTTHGLPNLFRTKFISIKIFWFILTFASMAASVYFIFKTLSEYYEYNVTTEVRLKDLDQIEFPTISLCNRNQFSTEHAVDFIRDRLKSNFNLSFNNLNDSKKIPLDYLLKLRDKVDHELLANVKIEDRQKFTTRMSDSLDFCRFGDSGCSHSDFEWFYSSKFGNCYKFNSDGKKKINMINKSLEITAYLGQPEILDILDNKKGYSILIESKNANTYGNLFRIIEIKSGIVTFVRIEKSLFIKHPKPYSNCDFLENSIESLSSTQMKYYQQVLELNHSYSQSVCVEICRQLLHNQTNQNCLMRKNSLKIPGINYCNDFRNNSFGLFKHECLNNCPLECETSVYDREITTDDFTKLLDAFIEAENIKFKNETVKNTDKVVRIKIFFDPLNYMSYKESPTISVFGLISNLGGTLGLFLGMSLLSFTEFIEIIWQAILIYLNEKKIQPKN